MLRAQATQAGRLCYGKIPSSLRTTPGVLCSFWSMADQFLNFSDRITCLPVIHGSGEFALEVRRMMLDEPFDCVAVPLPPSFKSDVESAVGHLPAITMVTQAQPLRFGGSNSDNEDDEEPTLSFVPIDPCQPVIAAIRGAMQERIPRAFLDLEVERFLPYAAAFPDPYALKKVPLAKFAAALLPALPPPAARSAAATHRDDGLPSANAGKKHRRILFVCSMLDWPWVRQAYAEEADALEDDAVEPTSYGSQTKRRSTSCSANCRSSRRCTRRPAPNWKRTRTCSVDGVKELLITARDRYKQDLKKQARPITPQLLALYLRYVAEPVADRAPADAGPVHAGDRRRSSLPGTTSRFTSPRPRRDYGFARQTPFDPISLGIDKGRLARRRASCGWSIAWPGRPCPGAGSNCKRRPERKEQRQWQMRWNPYQQCSWPPEDVAIERFRTHTFERAKQLLNQDLARSEKFTTSVMDGIDIRETLRNWHTGDIYVKNFPPGAAAWMRW